MASLYPQPKAQFFASDGTPAVGYKVYTYVADGTFSTLKSTYSDTVGTANTNPIILDSRGEATIFWGGIYDVKLTTDTGGSVWTQTKVGYGLNGPEFESIIALYESFNTASSARTIAFTAGGDKGGALWYNAGSGFTPTNSGTLLTHLAAGYVVNAAGVKYALCADQELNPYQFSAVGDGVTDDYPGINAFLQFTKTATFPTPPTAYLMNSGVILLSDNIEIDFGDAKFINGGTAFLFTFGATADTPTYTYLRTKGGRFYQSNAATTSNYNYIRIAGTQDFVCDDHKMYNVSNGGIYVEAGCADGLIIRPYIRGASGYSTIRGVWLNGATASDYASQLIDISTLTRNATALPVYSVNNVKVLWPDIQVAGYGVYGMNTRYMEVHKGTIDISGSGARCIAFNNYSPYAVADGVTIIGDQTSTGILATQYSLGVEIRNIISKGTFGLGRDIRIQYMADASITGCRFLSDSVRQILVDSNATAVIERNTFDAAGGYVANNKGVTISTIDSDVAGTSTYGDTATTLAGNVVRFNTFKKRLIPIEVLTTTSAAGNIPGLDTVVFEDNVLKDFDLATTSSEYAFNLSANGTTYKVAYQIGRNIMLPASAAIRNRLVISGTGYTDESTITKFATYRITNAASGGAITSVKLWGEYISCSVSRSGNNAVITPLTAGGAVGASQALLISVTGADGVVYSYKSVVSGSNYVISLYDSAGSQIALSTTAAVFDVMIQHPTT